MVFSRVWVRHLWSVFVALVVVLCLCGCTSEEDRQREAVLQFQKDLWFPVEMKFECRGVGGVYQCFMRSWNEVIRDGYTDVVVVSDESRVGDYPSTVIVAWPGPDTPRIVRNFNSVLVAHPSSYPDRPLSLDKYDLSFPLTVKDTWQKPDQMHQLFNALTESERSVIRSMS